jgi:plastocyanin
MRAFVSLMPVAALLLCAPPAAAAPRNHVVIIDEMKFGPVPATVRPGDRIIWVNRDIFRHTATARNGSFAVDLPPKAKATMGIGSAGSFAFYCKYHPGMTGVLKVAK